MQPPEEQDGADLLGWVCLKAYCSARLMYAAYQISAQGTIYALVLFHITETGLLRHHSDKRIREHKRTLEGVSQRRGRKIP